MTTTVLCPIHNVKMKKVRIIWGLPAGPLDEEVIYGGCCVITDEKGEDIYKYGYICPECKRTAPIEFGQDFAYVMKDGRVIPFHELEELEPI